MAEVSKRLGEMSGGIGLLAGAAILAIPGLVILLQAIATMLIVNGMQPHWALLLVSVLPAVYGMTGMIYGAGAVVCGTAILVAAVRFFFARDTRNARRLFMMSNIYLLTVMILLVVNARP